MDKKTTITIIIATILALIFSLYFKQNKVTPIKLENINKEESNNLPAESFQTNSSTEVENISPEENKVLTDSIKEDKQQQKKIISAKKDIKNNLKKENTETIIDNSASTKLIEEKITVEKNKDEIFVEDGVVIIPTEYKIKSPTKYSFKDFGTIDKVTIK